MSIEGSSRTLTLDFGNNVFTPPATEKWRTTGTTTIDVSGLSAAGVAMLQQMAAYWASLEKAEGK